MHIRQPLAAFLIAGLCGACVHTGEDSGPDGAGRSWLAGDHHVHSHMSVSWQADPNDQAAAPKPILGGDAVYEIRMNAMMARRSGLSWIVATDHGGPNHSKLSYEQAYPELLAARIEVPEVLQFYGMEFDTPGADHSSMILPRTEAERDALLKIESGFSSRDAWPADKRRDMEEKMLEALASLRAMPAPPVIIANHPSRSAAAIGSYGLDRPAELRGWNDAAPEVAIGMEGAPGHQAAAMKSLGSPAPTGARGGYGRAPTMGGFDQMTARLGGFWDSMLGEGRSWWITATSDSHRHWTDGGADFWPGEYAKTYVLARRDYGDILDGLRKGRIFVTTGDLVSSVDITARAAGRSAGMGGELSFPAGSDVVIDILIRDPAGPNQRGRTPVLARVDLISGDITGRAADPNADTNSTTHVVERFDTAHGFRDGETVRLSYTLRAVTRPLYVRVRGTNTDQAEPEADAPGEDPWDDLWFYTNPVFLKPR